MLFFWEVLLGILAAGLALASHLIGDKSLNIPAGIFILVAFALFAYRSKRRVSN